MIRLVRSGSHPGTAGPSASWGNGQLYLRTRGVSDGRQCGKSQTLTVGTVVRRVLALRTGRKAAPWPAAGTPGWCRRTTWRLGAERVGIQDQQGELPGAIAAVHRDVVVDLGRQIAEALVGRGVRTGTGQGQDAIGRGREIGLRRLATHRNEPGGRIQLTGQPGATGSGRSDLGGTVGAAPDEGLEADAVAGATTTASARLAPRAADASRRRLMDMLVFLVSEQRLGRPAAHRGHERLSPCRSSRRVRGYRSASKRDGNPARNGTTRFLPDCGRAWILTDFPITLRYCGGRPSLTQSTQSVTERVMCARIIRRCDLPARFASSGSTPASPGSTASANTTGPRMPPSGDSAEGRSRAGRTAGSVPTSVMVRPMSEPSRGRPVETEIPLHISGKGRTRQVGDGAVRIDSEQRNDRFAMKPRSSRPERRTRRAWSPHARSGSERSRANKPIQAHPNI